MIDIGHPGHLHLFKHFAHQMIGKGHRVHFTVRDKEFEIELLSHEGFLFTNFGKHYKSKPGKVWGLFKFTWLAVKTALWFKPDVFLSHGSLYNAFASFFLGKPNIALEDTGNREQVRLYKPFTKVIITSSSFLIKYGKKQIFYNAYHELAYLHPALFTPDPGVLNDLGVVEGEKYFILRFVSWNASHDIGQGGLSMDEKSKLIGMLKPYGKVFISSEKKLEAEFEKYSFSLPPWRMHDALAFCSLFVGEGATMASECAMLGTPAVYVNSILAGSVSEQQRYGLLYHFTGGNGVEAKIKELLQDGDLKNKTLALRDKMLTEKINLTEFLVWFIENYPLSFSMMKKQPILSTKY
jgi:predicted glycosyltransferase